jgi:hypothetical protein
MKKVPARNPIIPCKVDSNSIRMSAKLVVCGSGNTAERDRKTTMRYVHLGLRNARIH